jgi:hypothetical protein
MSTRNLPGGKGRPVHKADNLIADCLENVGPSTSQPYGPSRPVRGIALPLPLPMRSVLPEKCLAVITTSATMFRNYFT